MTVDEAQQLLLVLMDDLDRKTIETPPTSVLLKILRSCIKRNL
jgi:hypothetical protein